MVLGIAFEPGIRQDLSAPDACELRGSRALSDSLISLTPLDARMKSRLAGNRCSQEVIMRKSHLSAAGLSVLFALGLAIWEVYFFWFAGSFPGLEGVFGIFSSERLGFNMAWLVATYLTFQLISIPFSLPAAFNRFVGVLDGMASLVPLAVVLVAVFGKPHLIGTAPRWEAAFLLIFITVVDLFGGYTFNIALSRRTMDINPAAAA
jgi:hypothetical protein